MLPQKRDKVLIQCISNDITEIYLIRLRVSVTQPSTPASMEHRVAIWSFSIFKDQKCPKIPTFLSDNPDGTWSVQLFLPGPWRVLLGPCLCGPHPGDGAAVQLQQQETPEFISPDLWPPNSPDLNGPVDYQIFGLMQERVHKTPVSDTSSSISTILSGHYDWSRAVTWVDLLGHASGQGQDHIITNFKLIIVQCRHRTVWSISTDKPSSAKLIIWSWPWPGRGLIGYVTALNQSEC